VEIYLKNQEFFGEIVVLRDQDVTMENFGYFLQNYFPDRLRQSPHSRFLFAHSGHGMAEGSKENPTGYLLKNTNAQLPGQQNGISMSVLRVYVDQVIDAGYQTLILINAWVAIAVVFRLTSVRGFTVPEIAAQLGDAGSNPPDRTATSRLRFKRRDSPIPEFSRRRVAS
jgi:hypothetical protein